MFPLSTNPQAHCGVDKRLETDQNGCTEIGLEVIAVVQVRDGSLLGYNGMSEKRKNLSTGRSNMGHITVAREKIHF